MSLLIAALAEPGVWRAMLTARSLGLVFIVGPLAALLGLQLAVCASSRVNDPRSAQQLGALVLIIPVGVLQVAQFVGGVVLTAPILLAHQRWCSPPAICSCCEPRFRCSTENRS